MERKSIQMTDAEFDILDQLYFVISFEDLQKQLGMDKQKIIKQLKSIFDQGWLRIFDSPEGTADVKLFSEVTISRSFLLASKAGLKAHNS